MAVQPLPPSMNMARDLGERVWRMQRGKGAIYSTEGGEVEQKFERQTMKLQGSLDFSLYIYIYTLIYSINLQGSQV